MAQSTASNKRLPVGKDISTRRRVARTRRHYRLRKNISGTAEIPRLVVHRTSRHMHAQLIDDVAGHTLAAASTIEPEVRALDGEKKDRGARVGELIAERAKAAGISTVVFDRGGYVYHGRVAALAEGAREGGLEF